MPTSHRSFTVMCLAVLVGALVAIWSIGFAQHAFDRWDVITDNESKIDELQESMESGSPIAAVARQDLIEENRQLRAHQWDPLWFARD